MTHSPITLAHLSDTHVERRQYSVVAAGSGFNQREMDNLRAFKQVIDDINAYDPMLVVHSGDVADKPTVSSRSALAVQRGIQELTRRRDGSPRMVLVISGNHDMPRDPREPCFLEPTLRPLPSVAVVTNTYKQVFVRDYVARGEAPAELENVVLHALPHDQLKRSDWDGIEPVPGMVNILVSHGVVGGSDLYKQSHGREYAIPIDVLTRGWDYVAMGHWHKRGPISVGGFKDDNTPIWYAGSPEHCGFSDLKDADAGRGYLRVELDGHCEVPRIQPIDLPIRKMFRMPVLDAKGMNYEQITEALIAQVKATTLDGAVVDQAIINVHRDTWSLVERGRVQRAANAAMWFQMTPKFSAGTSDGEERTAEASERLGDVGAVLAETAATLFPDRAEREAVTSMAKVLLRKTLAETPATDEDEAAPPAALEPGAALTS